jgi:hypothetical protein
MEWGDQAANKVWVEAWGKNLTIKNASKIKALRLIMVPQEGLEPPNYALRSKQLYCIYISNCSLFSSFFYFLTGLGAVWLMFLGRINVNMGEMNRFTQPKNCNHGVTASLV